MVYMLCEQFCYFRAFGFVFVGKKYDYIKPNNKKGFPNVFNPIFDEYLVYVLEKDSEEYLNDPWVGGHFFDNELFWWGSNTFTDPDDYGLFSDIIILDSDNPILVQVKRRENPNHTELIKCVREFVGTMYIEGVRKGIYISTAKSFSRACQETQSTLLNDRKFEHFEYHLQNYN